MKIVVFTQDERLFIPTSIEILADGLGSDLVCIVSAPPLSTFRNPVRALGLHVVLFGLRGTVVMASRIAYTRIARWLGRRPKNRRYWSLSEIGEREGIPTYRVDKVNSPAMHEILDRHPADLLVSVSCPQIIRPKVLNRFSKGGINVHSAPLPRYRGLLPSFWTLYHGERETAVTVHVLADKLDNGDILLQQSVPIEEGETWWSLVSKTKKAAGQAALEAVRRWEDGTLERRENPDSQSTYFSFPTVRDIRESRARGVRMV